MPGAPGAVGRAFFGLPQRRHSSHRTIEVRVRDWIAMDEQLQRLQQDNNRLQSDYNSLHAQWSEAKREIRKLQGDLAQERAYNQASVYESGPEAGNGGLRRARSVGEAERIRKLKERNSELKDENEVLKQRVKAVEREIKDKAKDLKDRFAGEKSGWTIAYNTLQGKYDTAERRIVELLARKEELKDAIAQKNVAIRRYEEWWNAASMDRYVRGR